MHSVLQYTLKNLKITFRKSDANATPWSKIEHLSDIDELKNDLKNDPTNSVKNTGLFLEIAVVYPGDLRKLSTFKIRLKLPLQNNGLKIILNGINKST